MSKSSITIPTGTMPTGTHKQRKRDDQKLPTKSVSKSKDTKPKPPSAPKIRTRRISCEFSRYTNHIDSAQIEYDPYAPESSDSKRNEILKKIISIAKGD